MEADVRTIERVEVTDPIDVTVAVGKTSDGRYEAAVVSAKRSGLSMTISEMWGTGPREVFDEAPIVAAGSKYTAAGEAIDSWLTDIGDRTDGDGDGDEAAEEVTADAE